MGFSKISRNTSLFRIFLGFVWVLAEGVSVGFDSGLITKPNQTKSIRNENRNRTATNLYFCEFIIYDKYIFVCVHTICNILGTKYIIFK